MYHIFSLLLGFLALGMAVLGSRRPDFRFYSMTACGLSILCQLREQARLARIEDASAIFDTAPAASRLATALFCAAVLLNLAAICRRRRHEK